jgi:2-oxoglutarate dehydrogenase E2 component (dihydrolipoamide succinyltransferase)
MNTSIAQITSRFSRATRVRTYNRLAARCPTTGRKQSAYLPLPYFHQKRYYADKTFPVPPTGMDSVQEGTLGSWKKEIGQHVNVDEVVVVIETDKIAIEVQSPVAGALKQKLSKPGDTVRVGQDLYVVDVGATGTAAPAAPKQSEASAPKQAPAAVVFPTPAPAVASAAAPAATPAAPKPSSSPSASSPAPGSLAGSRSEHRVKMPPIRKRISQRLKISQNTAAMLTTFNEIDMHNIMELRNKYKDAFLKKHNVKLGFMSVFVKAASAALREFPEVNAVIEDETESILYRDYHDISVAVASPAGLVVPVIRNVEKLSFADVEKTIGILADKAKDRKLAIEDMSGGTFTISNGGVYGSMMGTPIINPPQSAILGMHAVNQRPYVVNGEIKIRPIMYVALTYDHRLIDGREAVLFLKKIKTSVEEPESLLLDL